MAMSMALPLTCFRRLPPRHASQPLISGFDGYEYSAEYFFLVHALLR